MHQLMSVLNSLSFSASHSSTYLPDFVLHGTSESMHSFQPKLEKHLASMVKVYVHGIASIDCMGLIKSLAPILSLPLFVPPPPPPPPPSVCLPFVPPSPFLFPLPLSFPPLPPSHPLSPLLISQHSTEDEPVEHGVAIIADTDTWTCRLVVATRDSQTK